MPVSDSQTFLRELDKKLWTSAVRFPAETEIRRERGFSTRSYKITSTGKLIDLIATIPFQHADLIFLKGAQASRLFLPEQTAKMAFPPSYFTPKSIVSLIVEMIEPYEKGEKGAQASRLSLRRIHHLTAKMAVPLLDPPAWRAHLKRAPRARRVRLRRKQPNQSNPTTWRLAAMNLAIRGIDFDFGKEPADTFTRDQHADLGISKAELRMWN